VTEPTTPRLGPVARPLKLGEVIAETMRVYGERIWPAFGIGAVVAGAISVAALIGNAVVTLTIFTLVFAAVYAVATRLVLGDSVGAALRRAAARSPVLLVLVVVVTLPLSLGVLDPLIGLVAAFWLGLVGLAIPVAVVEDSDDGFTGRVRYALSRSYELGRRDYLHAVGVIAALIIVYGLLGRVLVGALTGFAENGGAAAFLLAQGVLAPFLFLGLGVLYLDQRARAISSP
jgi:hypothetical protein